MIGARALEQGVDVHIEWAAESRAGLYFAELGAAPRASNVLYDRAGSAISRIAAGSVDWGRCLPERAGTTSAGSRPALSDGAAQLTAESLAAAKRAGLTVSYEPELSQQAVERRAGARGAGAADGACGMCSSRPRKTRVKSSAAVPSPQSRSRKRFDLSAVAVTLRDDPHAAIAFADGKIPHRTAPRGASCGSVWRR